MSDRNNILTASRMGSLLRCPRAHYWQYEVGLRKDSTGLALRVGSAWHRAMEARWRGADYETALAVALPEGVELDAYDCATIAGLLAGYYTLYGETESIGKLQPEIEFSLPLEGSRTFSAAGKIDGLGGLTDGRTVLVEAKTTGDSLSPESDYWLRLRFNSQVYQYFLAASHFGWTLGQVLYDVTRKPAIRPKQIADLDEHQRKIVVDANGQRVFKKNGEPRETACEGCQVKSHLETPDEFNTRLTEDCKARPEFYFARREVAVLSEDLEQFKSQRLVLGRFILHLRAEEKRFAHREDAWPRAVNEQNCAYCAYQSFCLQNISIDVNAPPEGFAVQPFNPELEGTSVEEKPQ